MSWLYNAKPLTLDAIPAKYIERFWSKVNKTDGCWLWTGSSTDKGYGSISINNVGFSAHRVSFVLSGRILPTNMLVCHHCDTRNCVRPDLLFLGTALDNRNDAIKKKRYPQASLTHCKHGHEFTPENTIHFRGTPNARHCRTCRNARCRKYYKLYGKSKQEYTKRLGK